ncbi:MAG: VOC family protein [Pseudomonadota bacterium]|jgi:Predicted enzyme related to lactoylglutathione lyase|nr:MAG: glyoxalase [Pseudomonadota bacterium]
MTVELIACIDVDDLDRATDFYCRALELEVNRRFGDAVVELKGASATIHLLAKPAGSTPAAGTAQRREYTRHWTPVHLDFVVPDVDAAVARAQAAGAHLEGAIRAHRWGRIAQLADPFGHGFCLIQFLNRGYDEIATPVD